MTRAGARPRALDLFAGAAGGWTLGLHRAGFETVAACEIDPWRRDRYADNFPRVRLYDDIRNLTAERLAADGIAAPWIVCGSPPCQDASAANTRGRGVDGERTGLYREWLRLVSELRPAWTCAENVVGLRDRGVDRLLAELESLDYAVWPLVVSAGDIGAPHRRERVWIVAADARRQRGRTDIHAVSRKGAERQPRLDRPRHGYDLARHGCDGGRPPEAPGWSRPEPAGDDERDGADASCFDSHLGAPENIARAAATNSRRKARSGSRIDRVGDGPDPNRTRPEIGSGERGDDGPELPAALRAWAAGWPHWNGGLAGLAATVAAERAGDLAHGLSARLAARERNRRIAAYGDSIVPQIAEAIGRAILGMEGA